MNKLCIENILARCKEAKLKNQKQWECGAKEREYSKSFLLIHQINKDEKTAQS